MMASLKIIRERKGVSQAAVAKELGISRQVYNNYELGKRQADYETLLRLAEYFGTTVENLIRDTPELEDEKPNASIPPSDKVHMIPIFGSVAAGFGAYADSDILGYMPLVVENSYDVENTLIIKVEGESMYPTICDGDKIVVRKQDSVDNGRIAVVMIGDEAVVKRIECDKNKLILHSINPMFSPRVIEGEALADCRIVGLVQQVIKAV